MAKLLYSVKGYSILDSWYAYSNDKYYAYFLQYPDDGSHTIKWGYLSIGLSISDDLQNWTYAGTVIEAQPGNWDDKGVATGSIVQFEDAWYILYTGNSLDGPGGIGVATSRDMIHFDKIENHPVIRRDINYFFPFEDDKLECKVLADPYIYPDPIDGWFYVFINSYAVSREVGKRGCITVMRSRDLICFEPFAIAHLSDIYDRLETPQVWNYNGNWFLYFGGVKAKESDGQALDYEKSNVFCISDTLTGKFQTVQNVTPPDAGYYIGKVIMDKNKNLVFLGNVCPAGVYGPYQFIYNTETGITFIS